MAKRKLARKSKGARKHVARKHVHRKVAKRVVRKQVRRAAPRKQPVDRGAARAETQVQQHADQHQAGAHLDAPSAVPHPGAGQSSGAVKSDTRVQS